MKLKRCNKGHIFNEEKSDSCPYCINNKNEKNIDILKYEKEEKTLVYMPVKIEPVVGWLVCIDGVEKGKDFRIIDQRNFIAINNEIGINILTESTEYSFTITYNAKQRIFVISPGNTNEIIYLNKNAIYETTLIENYNLIELNTIKLIFIGYCGENFNWKV
ncbi:hypothetical protein [Caviibacter abscessus]|uniref:hypothetical protein n=1 Tax=Caviibacter abscessus TaxID=1766719 RepID=UPI00082BAAC0|nr:hypothetical protein [Caviibacter abscessus]